MSQDERIQAARDAILASAVHYQPQPQGEMIVTVKPNEAACTVLDVLDQRGWLTKLEP